MSLRVGVDIGGTFTDFALLDATTHTLAVHKQLTTPDDPAASVLSGLPALMAKAGVEIREIGTLVHGTTLVTNAVIERRGAAAGMLCTKGFADVLDIGYERRYDMYDLRIVYPKPLVPRPMRAEIDERVAADGRIARGLDADEVRAAVRRLIERHGIAALAICFLNAYANADHENRARRIVAEAFPTLAISTSADVLPAMREYERWSTATMNAYTQPMFQAYVDRLERGLADLGFAGRFYVMTSGGGTVLPATARRYPVRMLESGPAAGVLLSAALGRRSARPRLLAFDMGGTTAKGALVRDGEVGKRYGLEVARIHEFKAGSGLPAMIPAVDLIEIGAGGGSLAAVDARGVIEAGPRSAGADPGPACYGRGGIAPTLTDANLLLGYLNADFFLGGAMALDRAAAERAIRHVADPLSVETVRAAWGVHETVNENVARAFRNHAAERGFDCRSSAMIAFGGSGPLHALRVARKLKVPEVVFPAAAGVMSAVGLLASPLAFDTLRSDAVMLDDLDADGFDRRFGGLAGEAVRPLHDAGIERTAIRVRRAVDARYRGQGYAIEVALPDGDGRDLVPDLPRLFAEAYAAVFAKSFPDEPVEVLNWKVAAAGPAPIADDAYRLSAPSGPSRIKGSRPAWCPEAGGFVDCPVYDRAALRPGDRFDGPALVEEAESTAILGFGDRAVVDAHGDLAVRVAVPGEAASGLKIAGAS